MEYWWKSNGSAGFISERVGYYARTTGISMGAALAITISWSENHSVLWAILHGFFSWLYVLYYALFL